MIDMSKDRNHTVYSTIVWAKATFDLQDACIPVVNTVLDKCLYGDKVVVSKVLDSGPNGEYPSESNYDAVLWKFVSSHHAVSFFRAFKEE